MLMKFNCLSHWLPVYKYIILGNWKKPGLVWVADCTRKLFKPSKDLASLVCNEKNFGFQVSCE